MDRDVDLSRLPRMVSWFRPGLLVRAFFHHLVAGIFGQYADQRVIQQISDPNATKSPEAEAEADDAVAPTIRHDYTSEGSDGAPFWVDFVSDLGDGFSSTYSVAYLMAADALRGSETGPDDKIRPVRHLAPHEVLTHGRILIMGGDEVYPWPSREAYAERLQQPYGLALPAPVKAGAAATATAAQAEACASQPPRDVFAIPGNHDWYDGLGAFDELFCRSRGAASGEDCNAIGGWKARQHRSYFAIKLPHNWWIWGADIQLSQHLDTGQLRYFRAMAEQMAPGDNFILMTAQPTWLQVDTPAEMRTREALRQLIDPPLRRGAKLCGIFSGDTHHYSRYNESAELGNFNLFIAGGGGAYIHGSHHLDDEIRMDWVGRRLAFSLEHRQKPKPSPDAAFTRSEPTNARAAYPTRLQSLQLAATNIAFPFRNLSFALAMGMIYWLVTWAIAEISVTRPLDLEETGAAIERVVTEYRQQERRGFTCDVAATREAGPMRPVVAGGAEQAAACYEQWKSRLLSLATKRADDVKAYQESKELTRSLSPSKRHMRDLTPEALETRRQQADVKDAESLLQVREPVRYWIMAEYALFRAKMAERELSMRNLDWWIELWPLARRAFYMLFAGLAGSPATALLVAALFVTFLLIAQTRHQGWAGRLMRWGVGTAHFLVHAVAMLMLFGFLVYINRHIHAQWIFQCTYNLDSALWGGWTCPEDDRRYLALPTFFWEHLFYPLQMILAGGLLAGFIFGIYLAIGYALWGVNDDWAFSALRSPDYRNFLRMRFEPGRLVVYPIGIDKTPRLRSRWALPGWVKVKNPAAGKPRVDPRQPITPRLIEGPIVINASEVRNIPRTRETEGQV